MGTVLFFAVGNGVLAGPSSDGAAAASGAASSGNAPNSLPQENFLSSIKESLRLGFDHDVVRGHFDLGSPPNTHRYYCLIDTRTGRREPNGVLGQPAPLPDGTTDLKIDSVSLYSCDKAEARGMLVTAGYRLKSASGAVSAPPPPPPPPQARNSTHVSTSAVDVAGIKIGMPIGEARAVLKAKKLRQYRESTETLGYWDSSKGAMQSVANGRFINSIATWTAPAADDALDAAGEAYEVVFTPEPGKERVMAIVHSVGYAPADAVEETALDDGLVKKYGGFSGSNDLPDGPTWRFQSGGNVQVGDPCGRRGLFGGLGGLNLTDKVRENPALKKAPDEFRFEIDHCGVAILTEDHHTANGGALRADRLVTRFTVTAYSPAVALEGAQSAAKIILAAKDTHNQAGAPRPKDRPAPNL